MLSSHGLTDELEALLSWLIRRMHLSADLRPELDISENYPRRPLLTYFVLLYRPIIGILTSLLIFISIVGLDPWVWGWTIIALTCAWLFFFLVQGIEQLPITAGFWRAACLLFARLMQPVYRGTARIARLLGFRVDPTGSADSIHEKDWSKFVQKFILGVGVFGYLLPIYLWTDYPARHNDTLWLLFLLVTFDISQHGNNEVVGLSLFFNMLMMVTLNFIAAWPGTGLDPLIWELFVGHQLLSQLVCLAIFSFFLHILLRYLVSQSVSLDSLLQIEHEVMRIHQSVGSRQQMISAVETLLKERFHYPIVKIRPAHEAEDLRLPPNSTRIQVPIQCADNSDLVLVLEAYNPNYFLLHDEKIARGAANTIALGLDSIRLRDQTTILHTQVQMMGVGHYLHDPLLNTLTASRMELESIIREGLPNANHLRSVIAAHDGLSQAEQASRRLKEALERRNFLNFYEALIDVSDDLELGELVERIKRKHRTLQIVAHLQGALTEVKRDARILCWFVLEEVIHNAHRHGDAKEVQLAIEVGEHNVILDIQDNGCGFDKAQVNLSGLANLRTLIECVGGTITIDQSGLGGASIHGCIPLSGSLTESMLLTNQGRIIT